MQKGSDMVTEDTGAAKPARKPRAKKVEATTGTTDKAAKKFETLADEAVAAGRKALDTGIGKKVDALAGKAETAVHDALDSDYGKKAKSVADDVVGTGRNVLQTELGKAMAVGAGIGAVVAIPIPFIGPVFGALVGAGIGYLNTVRKAR
jgi:hypothetical protein